jgi:hypothetical protein
MDDIITIRISRQAVRTTLLVLAAFLLLGFVVPLVLMNVDFHSSGVSHGKPVPANSQDSKSSP